MGPDPVVVAYSFIREDFLDVDIAFSDVVEYLDEHDSDADPEAVYDEAVSIVQGLRAQLGKEQ